MNQISLLDCTLRDGGYVNQWHFGYQRICDILEKLVASNVEYIECGYLSQKKGGTMDETQYRCLGDIEHILPLKHADQEYAVMINFGEYVIDNIPDALGMEPVIRVCFHKKDWIAALKFCGQLKTKKYRVFVQPMASLSYTDAEFLDLISRVNQLKPNCFYIVDSFGVMETRDLQRLINLTDFNLDQSILLGYHSHNNLQQAYGNAKLIVEQNLVHNLIIDASVYGMGRGAGNLNMELFAAYLNKRYEKYYNIDAFLDIMDEDLKPIFSQQYWGYSLPFYLSAQHNCHPNYACYFADKNTLTNKSMRQLLASLPEEVKNSFSEEKAEWYYREFQKRLVDDREVLRVLKRKLKGKEILILAPGKSIMRQKMEVDAYIDKYDPVVIAINIAPIGYKCHYLMCTNEKRYKRLEVPEKCQLILSSNLATLDKDALIINYSSYLNEENLIAENPTLMLLQLLIDIGMTKVSIAGFDGYRADAQENYFDGSLSMGTSIDLKLRKNNLIRQSITKFRTQMELEFVTESLYQEKS